MHAVGWWRRSGHKGGRVIVGSCRERVVGGRFGRLGGHEGAEAAHGWLLPVVLVGGGRGRSCGVVEAGHDRL